MITKSVKRLLLAVLALSLFAGSTLADPVIPSPTPTSNGSVSVDITVGETATSLKEMAAHTGVLATIQGSGIAGAANTAAAVTTATTTKFVGEFSGRIAPSLTTAIFNIGTISAAALEDTHYTYADAAAALWVQAGALAAALQSSPFTTGSTAETALNAAITAAIADGIKSVVDQSHRD